MLLVNVDGRIVFVNRKAQEIFGYSKQALLDLSVEALIPERYRRRHVDQRAGFGKQAEPRPMGADRILFGQTIGGREVPVEVSLSPLDLDGEHFVLVSVIDVSERERVIQLEKKNRSLANAANHDELTSLPNRRLFSVLFRKRLHEAATRDNRVILMFIDLDGFKEVNDTFGHEVGDKLLVKIASVLKSNIRASDVVARIGGDEFLMCIGGIEEVDRSGAVNLAEKLVTRIGAIKRVRGKAVTIGASIGVVQAVAKENVPLEQLLRCADSLMYQAKAEGKGRWKFSEYPAQGL